MATGEWNGGGGWIDIYARRQRNKKMEMAAIAEAAEKAKAEADKAAAKSKTETAEAAKTLVDEMEKKLASSGFPQQLTPSGTTREGKGLPIPAVEFHQAAPSLKKIFNNPQRIYITPDQYFTTTFREVFQKTKLTHHSGKESKTWLAGPNMRYWPQQLNFAVWCATTGCGISREIIMDDQKLSSAGGGIAMPENVRAFYRFHVYFTVRRILFQMGGIQNISALPGDPTFEPKNNKYDVASYKRLCNEFGIKPTSDFRFTRGANHGLGSVYIYVSNVGPSKEAGDEYPSGSKKFSDEGGTGSKGNLIYYIEPGDSAYAQADWFCPNVGEGLTQAGLSRINQSIEAFVYCVLGSQVNVRSSILGSGGRAKEAQSEFLVLVEDAIRQPDLAKSVQRYQLAIDQARVRLNFAVCPGAWLMPANMVINTGSVIGYNNQLKQAIPGMKLGVNGEVNRSTKKAGVKNMSGGPSKIKHAQPKDKARAPDEDEFKPPQNKSTNKQDYSVKDNAQDSAKDNAQDEDSVKDATGTAHENNKAYLIAGVVVLAFIGAHFIS